MLIWLAIVHLIAGIFVYRILILPNLLMLFGQSLLLANSLNVSPAGVPLIVTLPDSTTNEKRR